ncbi:hypothetical protein BJP34_35075 [Moorena producens PAL-8-15-08-1]|uniref:Uncharacterized protein n=1 Tax=Moorena producens PAL-8-15-08-1 TaxID=1458985 RepID=A0A1D8U251_9CYAN|nr:hypothetical protein [Moorena producens]AOX03958.1 hypothetical protein BJP34_35075 [Moorena producens PAL-8-15-08-1]
MARIAINDIQESESFLTELKDTDVAMNQINGGFFLLLAFLVAKRHKPKAKHKPQTTHKPHPTTQHCPEHSH